MFRFVLLSLVSVCAFGVGPSAFAGDDPLMANEFAPVVMSPRPTFVNVPAPNSGDVDVKDLDRAVVRHGHAHRRRHRIRRVVRAYCAPTAPIAKNIHPLSSSSVVSTPVPGPSAPVSHIPLETFGVFKHAIPAPTAAVSPSASSAIANPASVTSSTGVKLSPATGFPVSPASVSSLPTVSRVAPSSGFSAGSTPTSSVSTAAPSGFPPVPGSSAASEAPSGFPTAPTATSDAPGGFPTPPTH